MQFLGGLDGNGDLGASGDQGRVAALTELADHIGAPGGQVLGAGFKPQLGHVLTRQRQQRRHMAVADGDIPSLQRLDGIGRAQDSQVRDGAQAGQMLDRLVGRAVFAQTDAVMRHDIDRAHTHQRRQADRIAGIVREHQERAAIGDEAAMQVDAVHRGGHAEFAHAVADVAAGGLAGVLAVHRLDARQVRAGQVGRSADHLGQGRRQRLKRHLAGLAGRGFFRIGEQFGAGVLQRRFIIAGQGAGQAAVELGADRAGFRAQARFPCLALVGAPAADGQPFRGEIVRDGEGLGRPADGLFGQRSLVLAQGRAVDGIAAGLVGRAETDHRLHRDQRGFGGFGLGGGQRLVQRLAVMAVAVLNVPAHRLEPGRDVFRERNRGRPVDGDGVVIVKHDQLAKAQMAGKAGGLLPDAFLQAAVAQHDICVMIDQIVAKLGGQPALGQSHADGGGKALTQGAGGGLDALGMAVFRVAGGDRAPLPEVADLLDGHVFIAGQMQHAVKQH